MAGDPFFSEDDFYISDFVRDIMNTSIDSGETGSDTSFEDYSDSNYSDEDYFDECSIDTYSALHSNFREFLQLTYMGNLPMDDTYTMDRRRLSISEHIYRL
jgi:hypothetical protein